MDTLAASWARRTRIIRPAAILGLLVVAAATAQAGTRTVANGKDHGPGSLRAVIANSASGDTIEFAPGVAAVTLTTAALSIADKNLTIKGPGARKLTVRRSAKAGTPKFPIFQIHSASIVISGMTIRNGRNTGYGGAVNAVFANVTLSRCAISANRAQTGGAMSVYSTVLAIKGCTISDNAATAGSDAGALYVALGSEVHITSSTICRNSAQNGGAIVNSGLVTLTNSTVASNSAAGSAGGIFNNPGTSDNPIVVEAKNSIIAKNIDTNGQPDFVGRLKSMGHNLIGNTTGITQISGDTTGNKLNVDPMLGPLQDNGGPTWTRAPAPGSPAIDAGHSGGAQQDQRRFPRPVDLPGVANAASSNGGDIGAVEAQSEPAPRSLTVTTNGFGTVTSSPDGIDCGSDCSASFPAGTVVTLTAVASTSPASEESVFAGWSGACSGTDTCTVTMDSARSVTATFDLKPSIAFVTSTTQTGNLGGLAGGGPASPAAGDGE